jgi:tRNA threonylcarbamoyladenosine biosynthesis protein TsaB
VRLLAVDTSTEHCSAALAGAGPIDALRCRLADRTHADLLLPMIDELLAAVGWRVGDLEGLAFGRGPGGFTGLRLGAGVIQGLAFGLGLRVAAVSSLESVAFRVSAPAGDRILVCNDARMGEVYVGLYVAQGDGCLSALGRERVMPPADAARLGDGAQHAAGNGLSRYPELRASLAGAGLQIHDSLFPRADAVAALGLRRFAAGQTIAAEDVAPVYVRDDVVVTRPARGAVT